MTSIKEHRGTKTYMTAHMSRHLWLVLGVLCAAQFVIVLDFQSVSIALPAIQRALGLEQNILQWIVSAQALTFGGLMLLAGRISDVFGRRHVFIAGLGLFALASLLCGFASNVGVLIVARAVQGVAAALVTPAAMALISVTFVQERERNHALAIWGAVGSFGGVIGVIAGGFLTDLFGWPWVFWVNVPISTIALIVAWFTVSDPQDTRVDTGLDLIGAVLVTIGTATLVYGLTEAQRVGFGSPLIIGLLALALGLLVACWLWERHIKHPLVDMAIFHRQNVSGANLITLIHAAVTNTPIFFFALYMQQIRGYSPFQTGLAFLPVDATIIVGSLLATRLLRHYGLRATMAGGMIVLIVAASLLALMSVEGNPLLDLLPGLLLEGLGLGIVAVAVNVAGTQHVNDTEHGLAWGLINTSARIGTALGLATLVSIATARTAIYTSNAPASPEAIIAGFRWAFFAATALAAVGFCLTLFVIRDNKR